MRGLTVQLSLVVADGLLAAPGGRWFRLCPDTPGAYPLGVVWADADRLALAQLVRRVLTHLQCGASGAR